MKKLLLNITVFFGLVFGLTAEGRLHATSDETRKKAHAEVRAEAEALGSKVKKALGDKIKHVIVLMEENRSYDHKMGWYGGKADGLTGKEFNYYNPENTTSEKFYVTKGAHYVNPGDPVHSTPGTTLKLFGPKKFASGNLTDPTMNGFVYMEQSGETLPEPKKQTQPFGGVMQMFDTRKELPVFTALADNYISMDRFFAGMPGPTWPNRQFFVSATSNGLTETFAWYNQEPGHLYPQKTIFDQVGERNASWKVYYEDTPWELFMESLAHHPENLHSLEQFKEDCRTGDLPHVGYINPRSGINITTGRGSNDEHPDHDVALAEAYIKEIYEALRASPAWNETLFIITYDEHGGFYDHVPTPTNVPPPHPNMKSYPDDFAFDRLGVRLPTLLISPWVAKGEILSGPPEAQKPFPNSEYDTTSIMASVRKILTPLKGLPPLTDRDAWVGTWEHVLDELQEPRTDCPEVLPDAPPPSLTAADEAAKTVNGLQREIMTFHANLHGKGPEHFDHISTQGQVSQWLQDQYELHKSHTLAWKKSKLARGKAECGWGRTCALGLRTLDGYKAPIAGQEWLLYREPNKTGTGKMTLGMRWQQPNETDVLLCLDGTDMQEDSLVGVSLCYPDPDPVVNRDPAQWWTLHKDATLRPYLNDTLCVTNHFIQSGQVDKSLYLKPCVEGDVTQHYAYHGEGGNGYPGQLVFGDGAFFITVYAE